MPQKHHISFELEHTHIKARENVLNDVNYTRVHAFLQSTSACVWCSDESKNHLTAYALPHFWANTRTLDPSSTDMTDVPSGEYAKEPSVHRPFSGAVHSHANMLGI